MYAQVLLFATVTVCLLSTGQVSGYPGTESAAVQWFKAAVMKEWLHENQLAHIQADVVCNPKYGEEKINKVLSDYDLSSILNPKKRKTFLYVPEDFTDLDLDEERIYKSAGTTHAEEFMLADLKTPPVAFWITRTPCPDCALKLMKAYDGLEKALIAAKRFHVPGDGKRENPIDCLAKMMYQGFEFYPWEWSVFEEEYLEGGNLRCIQRVESALNNEQIANYLKKEREDLEKALAEANALSKDPKWIKNVAHKCLPTN